MRSGCRSDAVRVSRRTDTRARTRTRACSSFAEQGPTQARGHAEIAKDVLRILPQRLPHRRRDAAERLENHLACDDPPRRHRPARNQRKWAEDPIDRHQRAVRTEQLRSRAPAEKQRIECPKQTREGAARSAAPGARDRRGRPHVPQAPRRSRRAPRGRPAAAGPPSAQDRGPPPARAPPGTSARAPQAPRRARTAQQIPPASQSSTST